MPLKPFRFGVMAASATNRAGIVEGAKRAEDLGFSSYLYNDHYAGPGPAMEGANHGAQPLASIPAVTIAGEATSTLIVGFRVIAADYHRHVVLAKELATIDVLTDGRLEIGLGAGWVENEYEAMGIPYDPPGVRIRRLADVTRAIKLIMGDGQVSFEGESGVHASGFEGLPKPVQRPHPPITIGGGGRKILQLAAREADIVAFNVNNSTGKLGVENVRVTGAEATDQRVEWVREAAGERFDDLELEIGAFFSSVTDDAKNVADAMTDMFGLTVDEVLAHPHGLIGSVDAISDMLVERRERWGFSYVTLLEHQVEEFAPVVARMAGS
jgi:probable F420-dependent oxidoreductase